MNESLAERLNGKLHRLALLLFVAYIALGCFGPMMDNVDIGWHVAQGRWMVEHGAIYERDVLNYPNLDHAVIDEYPLFQVVLYAAWCLGWWGPCLLTALVYVALTLALIRAGRDSDLVTSSFLVIALGLMFFFLQTGTLLRPHMATYLAVVVLGCFLLHHRDATRWTEFWPMALLQIAWTNCHSGFVIGPMMVGLFGAEMTLRRWTIHRAFPWAPLRTWLGAFLLILLACFVNPFGAARFYPPFFQDSLESIRAYVGEMEPLTGAAATVYGQLAGIAAVIGFIVLVRSWKIFSCSFLILALLFFHEAESVKKAWPIFGLFVPLLVLSGGTFGTYSRDRAKIITWVLAVLVNFMGCSLLMFFIMAKLDGTPPFSLQSRWREYDQGRSELSLDAAAWMKLHLIEGRLFHRCEDGGWLQEDGYDHGETFADTGFGKYDEAFIHEVGLVGERPALLPRYLKAYGPDFVVCGNFCYQWPYYLRQQGWRPIFYSPNSSVWTQPETRPDLPTVTNEEIAASFDRDIATRGRPADLRLFGRNLIALNSHGLEDFAFAKLKALPDDLHHALWYWEAARILCFEVPTFSIAHRHDLQQEAEQLRDDSLTAEFRAYGHQGDGDTDGALRILEAVPPNQLSNYAAELLLKIYLDRKRPEALALAQRTDCWDLRNGRHWEYLAQAEEQAGHTEAAARAWKKAVFYYPDDATLMENVAAFAAKYHEDDLAGTIEASGKVYGK